MAVAAILKNRNANMPFWNFKNRHIWATIWPIAIKFGTATHVDPLDRADRQSYDIVKIQGRDSHTILGQTYDISY